MKVDKPLPLAKITEGKRVRYAARITEGKGKVVQVYRGGSGHWVIVHDKERNRSVTVRPSQVSAL